MNKLFSFSLLVPWTALCLASCASPDNLTDAPPVLGNYAAVLSAEYEDTYAGAEALRTACTPLFTSSTATQPALDAARTSWRAARVPYMQTEYARFYDGPIDDEAMGNMEALLNSWPLDENAIDYVVGMPAAGIVNDTSASITRDLIAQRNALDGDKNITTGYHAIEFLLWGQDMSPDGPGDRPVGDYVDGIGTNADRRREYLDTATQLVVDNLDQVRGQWAPDTAGNFRARFVAMPPRDALTLVLVGMGKFTEGELAGQRIHTPYTTKDQEDEHSCFSDNTDADYAGDVQGLVNAYFGTYTRTDGTVVGNPTQSLSTLVHARDPDLDTRLRAQLTQALADVHAWPTVTGCPSAALQGRCPFDRLITGTDAAPNRMAVQAVLNDLNLIATSLAEVATVLGLDLQAADFQT
jgi:putative iron-regulated protein